MKIVELDGIGRYMIRGGIGDEERKYVSMFYRYCFDLNFGWWFLVWLFVFFILSGRRVGL